MDQAELDDLKKIELPMRDRVEAVYNGTTAAYQVVQGSVVPLIVGMVSRSDYENAIAGSYYRMAMWLQSLVKLANPIHIQAVASAARSMFELLIDIKRIIAAPALTDAYHDFTFVRRFRNAKLMVEHNDQQPGADLTAFPLERAFSTNAANITRCDTLRTKHGWMDGKGKLTWPDHWDKGDAFTRAGHVDPNYQLFYRDAYGRLCWYMHAGMVGFGGVSADGLEAGYGWAQSICQQMMWDATDTVCTELNFFVADATLRPKIEEAKLAIGTDMLKKLCEARAAQEVNHAK